MGANGTWTPPRAPMFPCSQHHPGGDNKTWKHAAQTKGLRYIDRQNRRAFHSRVVGSAMPGDGVTIWRIPEFWRTPLVDPPTQYFVPPQ